MEKIKLLFWGKEHELEIVFDCYSYQKVEDSQRFALSKFLPVAEKLIDSAKSDVVDYIKDHDMFAEDDDENVENIYDYITPKEIFVKRISKRVIGLMCSYKFNEDDGFAICFENENVKGVGSQNIII